MVSCIGKGMARPVRRDVKHGDRHEDKEREDDRRLAHVVPEGAGEGAVQMPRRLSKCIKYGGKGVVQTAYTV